MESAVKSRNAWYIDGLHFECVQCGRCCSGPGEGYIWVARPEIQFIADYLKISTGEVRRKYLKRVGIRFSIIEDKNTKDCIFLEIVKMADARIDGEKRCRIYPVRPNQCRTWPFWPSNLTSQNNWNEATRRCAGINRGRRYTFDEIEEIRKTKKWWEEPVSG
jgi:Fe-S-cluster containining protein